MMMKTLGTGLVLAATLFTGSAQAGKILDKINDRAEMVACIKVDYRPFGYRSPNGDMIGLEHDLMEDLRARLSSKLGKEIKLEKIPVIAANRIQFLEQGKCDVLVATMTVDTLGHSLNRLRLPDKMVHLLLITYRYLFVIEQEYQRLVRAMKIRNFHPKTNLHSYRTYAYLVGMLFVRASERARRVHSAMICRGFHGRFISLRSFPRNPLNLVFGLGIIISLALLIMLEWVK